MSTYRYRDVFGGINGAYGVLTADTFTATNVTITTATAASLSVTNNLTVGGTINCFNINAANIGATALNVSGLSSLTTLGVTGVSTMAQINNTGLVRITIKL